MASIRELKKRLDGVRTAGSLAGAMKTVSTAKYARVNGVSSGYSEYASACRELTSRFCVGTPAADVNAKAYVLLSGNRGLCGSFNSELFAHFATVLASAGKDDLFIACGRMAIEHLREKGVAAEREFEVSDVPEFAQAQAISDHVASLISEGRVGEVYFVRQKFVNMIKHYPETMLYLPERGEGKAVAYEGETLLIPDADTVGRLLQSFCPNASVYSVLLEGALGAQSATLMAMRSAYDNAKSSANKLETAINRRRQGDVTAGVLETSSENFN